MSLKTQLIDDMDQIYLNPEMIMRLLEKLSSEEHYTYLDKYRKQLNDFEKKYREQKVSKFLSKVKYQTRPSELTDIPKPNDKIALVFFDKDGNIEYIYFGRLEPMFGDSGIYSFIENIEEYDIIDILNEESTTVEFENEHFKNSLMITQYKGQWCHVNNLDLKCTIHRKIV